MSDTFDSDIDSLPPVTKALRQNWIDQSPSAPIDAVANTVAMRATLDAVHALETRIATLEAG